MLRLFLYNFKAYFREKSNWIWNMLFPIAFLTVYLLAMKSLGSSAYVLPDIKVAIVEDRQVEVQADRESGGQEKLMSLGQFLPYTDSVKGEWIEGELVNKSTIEDPLIIYTYGEEEEAKEWLRNGDIVAIIYTGDELFFQMIDPSNAMTESMVIRQILEAYEQNNQSIDHIIQAQKEGRLSFIELFSLKEKLRNQEPRLLDTSSRSQSISQVYIYYFAVIAYIAFFPVNAGSQAVFRTEANQSKVAMRSTISPLSKHKRFLSHFLPILLFSLLSTLVFYFYTQIAGVELGNHTALEIILLLTVTLAALLTGTALAAIFSFNQNLVIGVSIAFPLFLGASSGLMAEELKTQVEIHAPWLNKVSPLGNAANALFYLKQETGGLAPYYKNLQYILVYVLVMALLTIIGLRRSRYDSL